MGASVWLIAGPTASGKSGLALRLAEAIGGEIVNADSMQIYADLRVLTARPAPAEAARAPHHLYGMADAAEAWSVGRWLAAAGETLAAIAGRGRPAIVVGGTGLYFRALTEGLADVPAVPAAVRVTIGEHYDAVGETAFRKALAVCDPISAERIQPGDRQRLIRAAAVASATGRPLPDWQAVAQPTLATGAYAAVALDPPRAALYARCDARLEAIAMGGGMEEAGRMAARRLAPELPVMKALGVREFIDAVEGRRALADAVSAAQLQTRRYAKRQATWFRNQTPQWPRIEAVEPEAQWAQLRALIDR